jgi:fatty acid desaturase
MPDTMEDNAKLIETLFEKATDYGKTSFELVKLKAVDKTSDIVSSVIPHSAVIILLASFMLFLNLGIAFWLGEILGKIFFGFFIVAAFYVIAGIVLHLFVHNWLKNVLYNYFVKQVLK